MPTVNDCARPLSTKCCNTFNRRRAVANCKAGEPGGQSWRPRWPPIVHTCAGHMRSTRQLARVEYYKTYLCAGEAQYSALPRGAVTICRPPFPHVHAHRYASLLPSPPPPVRSPHQASRQQCRGNDEHGVFDGSNNCVCSSQTTPSMADGKVQLRPAAANSRHSRAVLPKSCGPNGHSAL